MAVNVELRELAKITTGQSIRKKIDHNPKGNIRIIQAKDLNSDSGLDEEDLFRIKIPKTKNPKILGNGKKIFFIARFFHKSFPKCFIVDVPGGRIVASPSLLIIEPKERLVNIQYLHWFLNSEKAREFYKKEINKRKEKKDKKKTLILSKSILLSMPILFPELSIQDAIVNEINHASEIKRNAKKMSESAEMIMEKNISLLLL